MNMCTVREIREAIQDDCRSQRDMESTEIVFFKPYHFLRKGICLINHQCQNAPTDARKKIQTDPNRCHNSFMNCGFFHT